MDLDAAELYLPGGHLAFTTDCTDPVPGTPPIAIEGGADDENEDEEEEDYQGIKPTQSTPATMITAANIRCPMFFSPSTHQASSTCSPSSS